MKFSIYGPWAKELCFGIEQYKSSNLAIAECHARQISIRRALQPLKFALVKYDISKFCAIQSRWLEVATVKRYPSERPAYQRICRERDSGNPPLRRLLRSVQNPDQETSYIFSC